MRKDERGFFYFVDRIGDTFRWKGENVATSEVAEAICAFPGIQAGQCLRRGQFPAPMAGPAWPRWSPMADLDLAAFRDHLIRRLPDYARPLFLRIRDEMEVTSTFKYTKIDLVRQGYDPAATADAIYFDHPEREAFVRLDQALYDRIQAARFSSERHGRSAGKDSRCCLSSSGVLSKTRIRHRQRPHRSDGDARRNSKSSRRATTSQSRGLRRSGADVEQMLRKWQVQVTHPRYFGLFNPSVTLASIVADTLVAMYNPQLATWRTSPAANEIERHTLAWLAAKFGFPPDTGCEFHQRRRGGESLRGDCRAHRGFPGLWRTWAAKSAAQRLPST